MFTTPQGLVTHHDILEAIVGDIAIAGEPGESWAIKRDDGSWLLDGMLSTDDLKEVLGIKRLPGEDTGVFHTLAGFMMNHMARVPSVGEYFEWGGLRFEVLDMDGRRIDKVLAAPVEGEEASG